MTGAAESGRGGPKVRLSPAQRRAAQQLADGVPSTSIEPAILKALDRAGIAERFVPAAGHINFKAAYRLTSVGREVFRAARPGPEGSA